MHHNNIIVDSKFNLTDITVLMVDLDDNKRVHIKIGDTIKYDNATFKVISMEGVSTLNKTCMIGLIVKEHQNG